MSAHYKTCALHKLAHQTEESGCKLREERRAVARTQRKTVKIMKGLECAALAIALANLR